jgi:hypothetical protein
VRRPGALLPLLALCALLSACREPAAPAAPNREERFGRGFIEGRVRLSGTPPALAPLPTQAEVAATCGDTVPDRSLVLGEEGALADVVVSLADGAGLPEPEAAPPPAALDQRGCLFQPPVLAARVGSLLEVRNSDPFAHQAQALASSTSPVLHVSLPLTGSSVRKPLPSAPAILQLRCLLHPWMKAVVRTFDHSYFTTTQVTGHFRLQVPEGTHSLIFWHPRLPGVTRSVTVQAGETVRLEQVWRAEELR